MQRYTDSEAPDNKLQSSNLAKVILQLNSIQSNCQLWSLATYIYSE